jgi:flagellar basal-body rod protein FlgB
MQSAVVPCNVCGDFCARDGTPPAWDASHEPMATNNMLQSTTLTILEQMVNFAQTRQAVLAGNIANVDTPGYQARDLSVDDFQKQLKEALSAQRSGLRSPGETASAAPKPLAEVAKSSAAILRHDLGQVSMEQQATEMAKNQMQHNLALTILVDQYHILQTAIKGTV